MKKLVYFFNIILISLVLISSACNSGEIIEEMEEEVTIVEYPIIYKYNRLEIDSIKEYTIRDGELVEKDISSFIDTMRFILEHDNFRDEYAPAFSEVVLKSEEEVEIVWRGIGFPEESKLIYTGLEGGIEVDIEILGNEFKIPFSGEKEANEDPFGQLKFRVLYESICCFFYNENQRWSFIHLADLAIPSESEILARYLPDSNLEIDESNTVVLAFCSEIYELEQ